MEMKSKTMHLLLSWRNYLMTCNWAEKNRTGKTKSRTNKSDHLTIFIFFKLIIRGFSLSIYYLYLSNLVARASTYKLL